MTKKSNWLLGCGLGCAGLIAVIILIMVWGISLGRNARRGFYTAEATRKILEEKFGAPGDFFPAADGSIPAARLEIFLAVREATQEYRTNIIHFFSDIPTNEDAGREFDGKPLGKKIGTIFQRMRSAVGMGEDIGHLLEARNQALLDKGMSPGEYTYLYVLAYYSWLSHSPGDGPGNNANTSYVMVRVPSQTHRDLIGMLSNQLDSLADTGDTEKWNQWRSDLEGEIEEMKNNEGRVPWKDSLPQKTAESFQPFRDRLEQTYSPITNPFELSLPTRRDLFSFSTD
ncbi:MAG: hypothetical protein P8Y80_02250 [Acidobacteriota bacterium]|jgi:hypothetical protein